MDIRIMTRQITMCEACHYFMDNPCAYGNARYSCEHPSGPGGILTTDIVKDRKIHKDCPLPKVESD